MNRTEILLVQLAEECAEVQQQCCKALRFGLEEIRPSDDETNAQSITRELEDLEGIVHMLQVSKNIAYFKQENIEAKIKKVEKYLKYSESVGTLQLKNPDCSLDFNFEKCKIWETLTDGCSGCSNLS